jgi:hypothetical protein
MKREKCGGITMDVWEPLVFILYIYMIAAIQAFVGEM